MTYKRRASFMLEDVHIKELARLAAIDGITASLLAERAVTAHIVSRRGEVKAAPQPRRSFNPSRLKPSEIVVGRAYLGHRGRSLRRVDEIGVIVKFLPLDHPSNHADCGLKVVYTVIQSATKTVKDGDRGWLWLSTFAASAKLPMPED